MPPRSRRTVRGRTGYTALQCYHLVSGYDFFGDGFGREPDPAAIAAAWEDLGEELTALHSEHSPGSRPWGWWELAAPERRKRVDGLPHPFDASDFPERHKVLHYGRPNRLWLEDHFEAVYECQCAYLARLGLFTPTEKRLAQSPEWACWEENEAEAYQPHGLSLAQVRAWLEDAS